jgi:hypothetical protein
MSRAVRRSIRRVYRRSRAVPVIGGLVLAALGGCAADAVRAGGAREMGAVPGSALVDLTPGVRERARIDPRTGAPAGGVRTESSMDEGTGDGVGRWTVRTVEVGADGVAAPEKSAGHVLGPYGGVYLAWSRSVKDTDPDGPARLYVFEPPLIWYPAAIEPGAVFEDRARMTERDPDDESRVALSGRALRRVAIVDQDAPGWPFEGDGWGVAAELRVRVGPAEAVRRTTTRMDTGGAGDEFIAYSVRVLGVPIRRERWLVLAGEDRPAR